MTLHIYSGIIKTHQRSVDEKIRKEMAVVPMYDDQQFLICIEELSADHLA